MEEIKLDVQLRKNTGTSVVRKIRRTNFVPAIVYGSELKATPLQVDRRSYERIMRVYRGQNVIFHLNVMEGDKQLKDYSAIVKEEQHHPVNDSLLHIDFHRISLTEEVEVQVQIVTKGDPVGVKIDGGALEHALWELDVICLPTNIPARIEIEVGHLKIGDAVHVREISLPPGVRTKHDPGAMVVSVVPPMKEKAAAEEAVEPAAAEPEKAKEAGEKKAEKSEKTETKEAASSEKKSKEKTEEKK